MRVCHFVDFQYREAGRMDDLCTVGALHQSEGRVSGFLLVGLLADLTDCRQRQARLDQVKSLKASIARFI